MPGLDELRWIAINAPEHLFRYGINWNNQHHFKKNTINAWEQTEPGSLRAIMEAFAYVIPLIESKTAFNIEHIKTINKISTHSVQLSSKNFEESSANEFAGVIRGFGKWSGTLFSQCGIARFTSTAKGIHELLASHQAGDCHCETLDPDPKPADKDYIEAQLNIPGSGFIISGYRAGFSWYDLGRLQEAYEIISSFDPISEPNLVEAIQTLSKSIDEELLRWQSNMTDKLDEVFRSFYTDLASSPHEANDEKLAIIIKFVQRLEHIHPFWDGNTRTFAMVLLNALLMQHGFVPTLFDDPNKFDGFAVSELVDLVKEGMIRTHTLLDYIQQSKIKKEATQADPMQCPDWLELPTMSKEDPMHYVLPLVSVLQATQSPINTKTKVSDHSIFNVTEEPLKTSPATNSSIKKL